MSKEVEALKHFVETSVWNDDEFHEMWDNGNSDLEIVKKALQRLEAIDNANPSEALEHLKDIDDHLKHIDIYYYKNGCDKDINIIKQALLKAQEQEKVLEIIKKKQVDVNLFITIIPFNKSIEELARAYNQCFIERCKLTIEETTLLKEVLEE